MKTPDNIGSLPHFSQLSEYETWASLNWLHQLGSDDAQLHARAKLDEEVGEFREALSGTNMDDIISEGGDVLWTANASGINTDISLSSALSYTFPDIFSEDRITSELIDTTATHLYAGTPLEDIHTELQKNGNAASKYTKQWFRLRHIVSTEIPSNFTEAITWTKHHRGNIALARVVLLTSYGLQEYAGANLQASMQDNYKKIESRLASGNAVTKTPQFL